MMMLMMVMMMVKIMKMIFIFYIDRKDFVIYREKRKREILLEIIKEI